jgi:hypothetical protein
MCVRRVFHFVGWLVHGLVLVLALAPAAVGALAPTGRRGLVRGGGRVLGPGAVCWRGDGCVAPSGM